MRRTVSAKEGLANALKRQADQRAADESGARATVARIRERLASRDAPIANAKPAASIDVLARAKILNHAVKTDPALHGFALDAVNLLANDDFASFSGSQLVKYLKINASARPADPDRAARAEMLSALRGNRNSHIEADAGSGLAAAKSTQAASVWDRAIARVYPA